MTLFETAIGATPCEEACAQLGVTRSYDRYAFLEAQVYRAALIALFGVPPGGASLRVTGVAHDFGRYYEVHAFHDSSLQDAQAYVERVQAGCARWLDAGFTAPILYGEDAQVRSAALCPFTVVTQTIATLERQRIEGFGSLDEAMRIARLREAYPEQAADADQLLRQIATETAVRPPSARRVGLYAPYRLVFMPELFHQHREPRCPKGDVIDIEARERRSARHGDRYMVVDLGSVATPDQAIEACWEHFARYVIP